MSIIEALERAKRLGKEKEQANAARRPKRVPVPTRSSDTQPVAMPQSAELPRYDYLPSICEQNRIVVPEVDAQLAQRAAPSYRMLRTRILQRCRTNQWSAIAITSPGPGEGKSVTALNLAIGIAREGNQDVFLLDCDMRNPSLCRYLGVHPNIEIGSYFKGECPASSVFFSVGIDRLTLAGGVVAVDNASELLATDRLEELLACIRRMSPSPLIILDLPPVVNTDDALVVAPRVDTIFLVISEGVTRRDGLDSALSLLADFPVAGAILNKSYESISTEYYGST